MTPQQLKALDFFRECQLRGGVTPTVRELARCLSLASTSSAQRLVDRLVASGHLLREPNKARGLRVAEMPDLRLAPTDALRAELARRGETLDALRAPARRAYGRKASCAADTCGAEVPFGHLFCRPHWFSLPRDLQEGLKQANARGDRDQYQELLVQARDIADGCAGPLS